MKKIFILIILVSTMAVSQTKVGSTAAPFLNIGVGPRAISMGGAFVATANDVSALYWNPAGISRMQSSGAFFAHTRWFADINYNWAGAVVNIGDIGSAGLSLTYLDYGKMEVTTLGEPDGTGEFFSAHDLALAVSYSYNLTDRFSLGLSAKYINQKIWNSTANGFAVDVGSLFLSDIYGIRIGASISNFGGDMQMDGKDLFILYDANPNIYGNNDQVLARLKTDAFPLPLLFRVGLAKDFILSDVHRITVGIDALHPNDNAEAVNIGTEYSYSERVMFRGGYNAIGQNNSEQGFSFGVGIKHDFSNQFGMSFDYAYQNFGILEYTQHFAVSVRF